MRIVILAVALLAGIGAGAKAATPVQPNAIDLAIAEALAAEGAPARLKITRAGRTVVADAAALSVAVEAYDSTSGQFTVSLDADGDAGTPSVLLRGRAEAIVDVPVLNRDLAAGDIVAAADIDWIEAVSGRVQRNIVLDADGLIGLAAKRSLRAGQPLRTGDVARPTVVHKGEIVLVTYSAPGIQLTTRGRVMADGAVGDVVSVVNGQSHRTIEATVVAAGAVAVTPVSAPIATASAE